MSADLGSDAGDRSEADRSDADRGERFQRHVSAALNGPFPGLLHADGTNQAPDRRFVGKDAADVCAPFHHAIAVLLNQHKRCAKQS